MTTTTPPNRDRSCGRGCPGARASLGFGFRLVRIGFAIGLVGLGSDLGGFGRMLGWIGLDWVEFSLVELGMVRVWHTLGLGLI